MTRASCSNNTNSRLTWLIDSAVAVNQLTPSSCPVVSALTVVGGLEIVSEQFWRYVVSVITMIVCLMWWWMLDSYRSIAEAKFKVIHEIERALPFAMFADEEQHYKSSKRYKPLSGIEQVVPMLFLVVNLVSAVASAVIT